MAYFLQKKSSKYNLSWRDAVDEALCFGWIDSVKKSIDTEIQELFFEDMNDLDNANKLKKTLRAIEQRNGLAPSDDLTIIRVIAI